MISEFVFTVVAFVALVLWCYVPRWYLLLKYKLPPGPVSVPFLGYLPLLNKDTGHLAAQKLAKKYGSIVSLYIGNKLVVILDDFESLKASYNQEEFLNRPDKILELGHGQFALTDSNGGLWKEQRRFMVTCLRNLTSGNQNFESINKEYILEVCSSLNASGSQQVQLDKLMDFVTNNITYHLIYGKRFEASHPMICLLSEYHTAIEIHVLQNILKHFLPPVAYLMEFTPKVKATRKILQLMDETIRTEILEHQTTLNANEPRDIVDFFLLNMEKPGLDEYYNMPSLIGNVKGLLAASSDSVKSTLVWFFLLMAKHQDVQKKIQTEIDTILGTEREPRNSDRGRLPYTEAAIWESMRHKNIASWNLMRSISKDTTLRGFDIPEGSLIMHNMSSHFHNPLYFERPQDYDPSRFLTRPGTALHVPEHFVPFSYGKRNCIGDKIAMSIIFLFSTTLLQRFDIIPPEGGVDLQSKTEFVNVASQPYVRISSRV